MKLKDLILKKYCKLDYVVSKHKVETLNTYSNCIYCIYIYVPEQRPPVNKGHFFNSLWLSVVRQV